MWSLLAQLALDSPAPLTDVVVTREWLRFRSWADGGPMPPAGVSGLWPYAAEQQPRAHKRRRRL